jgi:hypothetical protein
MCTVSFVPVKDGCIITSNRDEKLSRKTALPPVIHQYNGVYIFFPRDTDAGGTWIATKENGDTAVLLNGAFIPHISEPPYRKSRGLILLDILSSSDAAKEFLRMDLLEIEPFTLVLFENKMLHEFRWDGEEKYSKQLDEQLAHIWSSVTLYDGFAINRREKWFNKFLANNSRPAQKHIIDFHCFGGEGDINNDLRMQRQDRYATVSITSIKVGEKKGKMVYLDLKENKEYQLQLSSGSSEKLID